MEKQKAEGFLLCSMYLIHVKQRINIIQINDDRRKQKDPQLQRKGITRENYFSSFFKACSATWLRSFNVHVDLLKLSPMLILIFLQLSDNLPFLLGLDSSSFFGHLFVNNFPNKTQSANTTHYFSAKLTSY